MSSGEDGRHGTLARWLIDAVDGKAYRSGNLSGMKHPKVDKEMIEFVGGLRELIIQARELRNAGVLEAEERDMGNDIRQIHYPVSAVPKLCRMEKIEDPRARQLRYISLTEKRKEEAAGTFLTAYYDNLLARLERGDEIRNTDLEDDSFFRCINAVAKLREPVWRRVFSSRVFGNSKTFESAACQPRVLSVLEHYSPLYQDNMTVDEVLGAHGIMTYSQTLEWKGPLLFRTGENTVIDTAVFRFGTVINAQTLEHAVPCGLPGVKRVITIENKTNYEDMVFSEDTLYIFCHGFFSPKETAFLKKLVDCGENDMEYYHWGDMDLGGIRIFLFNRDKIFPELKPYRMDRETYEAAVGAGYGSPLEAAKRKKLMETDAGILDGLKTCILKYGLEVEQEQLLLMEDHEEDRLITS